VSRGYSGVAANQTAQDYAAAPALQLSGTVAAGGTPIVGVAFTATNGGTCTSSNASGQYSCNVPQGWSGSVTPSLNGYSFTPASREYSNVTNNQAAQDFAAMNVGATTVFYIHPDHLNTPRMIANATGTTVWRWDQQEPFGSTPPNDNPSGLGAFDFPLRFPGQYFDRETNLAYNFFRDYDPGIGRYVESDPLGIRAGLNTYAYVRSKPLTSSDPTGLLLPPNPPGGGGGQTCLLVAANRIFPVIGLWPDGPGVWYCIYRCEIVQCPPKIWFVFQIQAPYGCLPAIPMQ
jgi:RHS repeat-associated protein